MDFTTGTGYSRLGPWSCKALGSKCGRREGCGGGGLRLRCVRVAGHWSRHWWPEFAT